MTRIKEPLVMLEEVPLAARRIATTVLWHEPPAPDQSAAIEQNPARKIELLVLGCLFLVTLFCTMGTYYWRARAWPSRSLWDTISLRESEIFSAQSSARFKEYQRWVPIRKGDYVVIDGSSAANARMVTAVPRDSVILRDNNRIERFIVLGANSFLVRTAAGGDQIVRRDEISAVVAAQTASR